MVKSLMSQRATELTRLAIGQWKTAHQPRCLVSHRKYSDGANLKEVLAKQVPQEREKMMGLKCLHGDKKLGDIKLSNVMGGMRGLMLLMCDTSYVDPNKGIFYRGMTLKDVVKDLPRVQEGSKEGTPEGAFWLLTTGKMPNKGQAEGLTKRMEQAGQCSALLPAPLDSMDQRIHPMAQLCAASSCLDAESKFVKAYRKGVKRAKYWEYIYEDAMDLCAMMPPVAAIIYCNAFKDGAGSRELNPKEDWSGNFCRMCGYKDKNFIDLMRLYFVLHADHESGNVSAHATQLVGSALSSPYLSFSAGMAGLAGPLHGLANQEVLIWLQEMIKEIGDDPKDDEIITYVNETLKSGKVVPGYGHAVLRQTDPRFELQNDFAMKNCKDDKNVKLVTRLWKLIPEILKKLGKVANPYPNVDAHSGVLLQHYGLKEMQYYTVLFGVSRVLGVMAQTIWARALGAPIERPKSFTSDFLCKFLQDKGDDKKAGGGKKK